MKKIIALSLVSIVSLFLVGCKKEKEGFSLVGTTWAAYEDNFYWFDHWVDEYKSWRFVSDTEIEECTRLNSPNGKISGDLVVGVYSLNYPNLIVTIGTNQYNCSFINTNCFRVTINDKLLEFSRQ